MEILDKTKESVKQTNKEIISQSLGLISSAFVLVAALAWNDAIKNLIMTYLKDRSGLISQFIYAIVVTAVAVIVTSRLNKILQKINKNL